MKIVYSAREQASRAFPSLNIGRLDNLIVRTGFKDQDSLRVHFSFCQTNLKKLRLAKRPVNRFNLLQISYMAFKIKLQY